MLIKVVRKISAQIAQMINKLNNYFLNKRESTGMDKLIIKNESSHSIGTVLRCVAKVVENGRVSGDQYCYVTSFTFENRETLDIHAFKNEKSDRFLALDGWTH